jgi:hypothetical protein
LAASQRARPSEKWAFFSEKTRTVSVVALTDLTALKLSSKGFDTMFRKIPKFGLGLSQGLAHRLDEVSVQIPLPQYAMRKTSPEAEVLRFLPKEFCQRHRVPPLEVGGNVLTLGVVDDPSTSVVSVVRQHVPSMELNTVRTDMPFFNDVMQAHSGLHAIPQGLAAAEKDKPRSPELDEMLKQMVAEGASDLHLYAHHKPCWHINGDMQEMADGPVLESGDKNVKFDLELPSM